MKNQRRNFLKAFSLSSLGALLPNVAAFSKAEKTNECLATTSDVVGPFYLSGAPYKVYIASETEPGDRLSISGKVYGQDCSTPLSDAIVDVWQASAIGRYDTSSNYKLRGKVITELDGTYAFETVYPGSYDGRPAHIHLNISAPGFKTLITQLYFEGDPLIPNDPFASRPGTGPRIIPLRNENSHFYGTFDIYLASNTTGLSTPVEKGYLAQAGPNPFVDVTNISYSNYENAEVSIAIYDTQGRIIKELLHQEMPKGKYTIAWDGLSEGGTQVAPGVYICKMEIDHEPLREIRLIRK